MNIKTPIVLAVALLLGGTTMSLTKGSTEKEVVPTALTWLSMEEAVAAQKESPKPVFVDVYTDWCKWCKVMDSKTFKEQEVIEYMSANFYMVKLDAEQQQTITVKDRDYKHVPGGRNGVHELAVELLDGQLSYPAFVVLNTDLSRAGVFKGFKDKDAFLAAVKEGY